jgi:hypothetical protein
MFLRDLQDNETNYCPISKYFMHSVLVECGHQEHLNCEIFIKKITLFTQYAKFVSQ